MIEESRRLRPLAHEPSGSGVIYGDHTFRPALEPIIERAVAHPAHEHGGYELRIEHGDRSASLRMFSIPPGTRWLALVDPPFRTRAAPEVLTPREMQVFELAYFELRTNQEIAEELGIGVGTVRNHLQNIHRQIRECEGSDGTGSAGRAPPRRRRSRAQACLESILDERDVQIARMAASGRTNLEIGGELQLSPVTVGTRLTGIYRALGVRGRHGLAPRILELERGCDMPSALKPGSLTRVRSARSRDRGQVSSPVKTTSRSAT